VLEGGSGPPPSPGGGGLPSSLLERLRRQQSFAGVGRNDICPCGSGKRYKNCHGR
jgi:preprotein translocase subunit SecA